MDALSIVLFGIAGVITAFILGQSHPKRKKQGGVPVPPKNTAADAARDNVQETFEAEVDRIKDAAESSTPADDLADLGNARKRR